MEDLAGQPIDGLEPFENFNNHPHSDDNASDDGVMDADLGPLEFFDSSAVEAPFSSLTQPEYDSVGQAPAAVMSEESPAPKTRKSKREKKSRKKDAFESAPVEDGASASAGNAATESTAVDRLSTLAAAAELGLESPINQKRKRELDVSSGKKRSKKRHQTVLPVTNDSDLPLPDSTLHDQTLDSPHGLMSDAAFPNAGASTSGADLWREHLQSDNRATAGDDIGGNEGDDTDMVDEDGVHHYGTPPENGVQDHIQAETTPNRPKRVKKAKPTYYENPPLEQEEPEDLPSPSAMTPKPRGRAKPATRKAKAPRRRRSSDAGDEEGGGERKARRSKTEGYTQGRFTAEELQLISNAVETFREENNLSQTEVNEMIHAPGGTSAGDAHAQLWTRLFAECPDRHRQKVINITRKKFHNFVARGTWTPEQEAEFRQLIQEHGEKWSKIAALINRHPEDLRDRYRNYIICGDSQKKDAWTEAEELSLTYFVLNAMHDIDRQRAERPSDEYIKKPYEEIINWQDISHHMNRTRSRLQCITKWKAMHLNLNGSDRLSSMDPDSQISFNLERARRQISDMSEEDRVRFLLAIRDSNVDDDKKIPWQKLVDKDFRSHWHRTTQLLLWIRFSKQVPEWEQKSPHERASYLVDQYNEHRELPDIDGQDWNDQDEMQGIAVAIVLWQRKPSNPKPRKSKKKDGKDEGEGQGEGEDATDMDATQLGEHVQPVVDDADASGSEVVGSGAGENGATPVEENVNETTLELGDAPIAPGPAAEDGLQIDPALTADAVSQPSTEPAAKQRSKTRNK